MAHQIVGEKERSAQEMFDAYCASEARAQASLQKVVGKVNELLNESDLLIQRLGHRKAVEELA